MLPFLRRNQGTLMIIVAVVIIISFVFFGNGPSGGSSQGSAQDTAFTLDGKDYSFYDLSKLQRTYDLARGLQLSTSSNLWANQMIQVSQRFQTSDQVPIDFAFNLALLRAEAKKFQIHVSDAEARDAFRALPVFQGENGFDGARAEFFQNQLKSMGFDVSDIYAVLKDWLSFIKLQETVTGSFVASETLAEQLYRASYQTIKVSTIPFALEDFRKMVQVTDEDIQKAYDSSKEEYQSDVKRGIQYVFAAKPDTSKLSDEEKIKANNVYGQKVNEFAVAVLEKPAIFAEKAKADGFEVKTVPAFAQSNPPAELKDEFALLATIFGIDTETTKVSDPIESEKGYFMFTVTEDIQPKQLELAEVKDRVKEKLTQQKAQEALTAAANDAKTKIEASLKTGKSFEDAAKEAGVKTQDLAEFTPAIPLSDISNGQELAGEARNTPAGQFTKALAPTPSGSILAFVKSKELRKREEAAELRKNIIDSLTNYSKADIFRAWFDDRREQSDLDEQPVIRRMAAGA